jgi:ribose 5-phosphate isomerase B
VKVAIGADHAGYALKSHLVAVLEKAGHEVEDLGTHGEASTDYPAFCAAVGRAVARGDAERGIVLGGSGQGEQIAANKVLGVRAALCNDLFTARLSRQHNDANVLSMGSRVVAPELAEEILELWLATDYDGGRHQHRVDQLAELEAVATDPEAQDDLIARLLADQGS